MSESDHDRHSTSVIFSVWHFLSLTSANGRRNFSPRLPSSWPLVVLCRFPFLYPPILFPLRTHQPVHPFIRRVVRSSVDGRRAPHVWEQEYRARLVPQSMASLQEKYSISISFSLENPILAQSTYFCSRMTFLDLYGCVLTNRRMPLLWLLRFSLCLRTLEFGKRGLAIKEPTSKTKS